MIKLSAITSVIWKPKSQNDRMKAEWGLLHKPVVAVSVTNCDNIYGRYNTFPFSTCFPAPLNLLVFTDYLGIVLNKPITVYQLAPLLLHPS